MDSGRWGEGNDFDQQINSPLGGLSLDILHHLASEIIFI